MKKTRKMKVETTLQDIIDLLDRFVPEDKSKGIKSIPTPPDTEALGAILQQYGIDTTAYGKSGAKGLPNLLKELNGGESRLALSSESMLRLTEPVFITLRFTANGVTRYLVEEHQTFPDGRERTRKMLVAEKKRENEGWAECALRGLAEELALGNNLRVMAESYRCFEEEKRSLSYPGLLSRYVTHAVCVDLTAPEARLGLPHFASFETTETSGLSHRWAWWTRDQCANLVGFACEQ